MPKFYVSLSKDLLDTYIEFEAKDELAVRFYMQSEYRDQKTQIWKLPWCTIYNEQEIENIKQKHSRTTIVKAQTRPPDAPTNIRGPSNG